MLRSVLQSIMHRARTITRVIPPVGILRGDNRKAILVTAKRHRLAAVDEAIAPPDESESERPPNADSGPSPELDADGKEGQAEEKSDHFASIFPGESVPLPPNLVRLAKDLENELQLPVWLLIQPSAHHRQWQDFCELGDAIYWKHVEALSDIPKEKVAIVVDSPGGFANTSYQLARLFQKRCGSYISVVPRFAKSAATLFALGAEEIVVGDYGELGPLDAQWSIQIASKEIQPLTRSMRLTVYIQELFETSTRRCGRLSGVRGRRSRRSFRWF